MADTDQDDFLNVGDQTVQVQDAKKPRRSRGSKAARHDRPTEGPSRVRFRDAQARAKLHVDQTAAEKEAYQLRWVNDDGTRIAEAQARGYEFVDTTTNDEHGGNERRVGVKQNGQRMNARLMRIPKKFHDEDMEDRRELRRQQREAMQKVDKDPDGGVIADNAHSRMTQHQLTIS